MNEKEYLTSDFFVWDVLQERGARAHEKSCELWQEKRRIDRLVLSWPENTIQDDAGKPIDNVVVLQVPENISTQKALVDLTKRTRPFALLLVEEKDGELRTIMESHLGSKSWTNKIAAHGDVKMLERTNAQTDVHSLGILWRKKMN